MEKIIFEVPYIAEVVEKQNDNVNAGKETCDSLDWSGCCYNG